MRSIVIPFLIVCFLLSYIWFLLEVSNPNSTLDVGHRKVWFNSSMSIFVLGLLYAGAFDRKTKLEKEFYKIGFLTVSIVYGTIIANNMLLISDPAVNFATFLFCELTMVVSICFSAYLQGLFKSKN